MASPIRIAALRRALTQLGVTEHPPDSNDGPEIRIYRGTVALNLPPGPWCMYFVHWAFSPWVKLGGWGSVQEFEQWASQHGNIVTRPFRGDIVCYDWNADNWYDHVGIVARVLALRWRGKAFAGYVRTVEGNTSVGNDSDGGKVMIRYRWIGSAKFARILGTTAGV